jgi:hypothetical protein
VTAPARSETEKLAPPRAEGAKRLRVALVRGGRVVEERVVPAPVSVGSSARATLAVPASDLPPVLTLFAAGREGPALVEGGAERPLAMGASGRVEVGEITVLYEVVPPPPAPPRRALPAAARGNRFRSLDRMFVGLLVAALALHVAAYLGLASMPVREEVTLEEIPDRFAKLLIPAKVPEPVVVQEKKPEPVAEAEEKPVEEAKPADEAPQPTPEQKAARSAAVAKAVQSKGLLRVLGSLGSAGGAAPAVAEVFGGEGGGGGDVAQALSGVAPAGAAAAEPGGPGGRRGAAGAGGAATIGDLGGSGGGRAQVDYGAKTEVAVAGTVAAEAADIDSAEVDQVKLASFVKARMAAIKACYETQLKRNPSLHGKIRIRFTILETGGLDEVVAAENGVGSPEVAACIVGTMRSWRTPFRPSGTVTVEYPFVFSAN